MTDFPPSPLEFQRRFPRGALLASLPDAHWQDGFTEAQPAGMATGTMTAGTAMHGSKPKLVWFWAAYLTTTQQHLRPASEAAGALPWHCGRSDFVYPLRTCVL